MTWWYEEWSDADVFYTADKLHKRVFWDTVFAWSPVRCDLTGKILWLTKVRKGTYVWPVGERNMYSHRYHEMNRHLIWALSK